MKLFRRKQQLDKDLEALYNRARYIVEHTANYDEAARQLMEQEGINEQYARSVINNLFTLDENKVKYKRYLWLGGLSMLVPVAVALISAKMATDNGGGYMFILYGLFGFGLITFLRAFILYK